jgi:hypothetical protein
MTSFIQSVVTETLKKHPKLDKLVFVLPTRRALVFLKKALSSSIDKPIISPELYSIEDFVEHLSGLKTLDSQQLLFEFYEVYKQLTPAEAQEPFEQFYSWASMILQDFNEIDRFLIDPEAVFSYLKAIKDIEHWSLQEPTPLIQNYLNFWNQLYEYYGLLNERLSNREVCYQGMAYRRALEYLEVYVDNNPDKQHIFLGFNALNTAESQIIQELLQNDMAEIYWDTDKYFYEHPQHSAGLYMRGFNNSWPYYKTHEFQWISSYYQQTKHIAVRGVPGKVGQAKYVGQQLQDYASSGKDLSKVAVVLGEESLLLPLLNSIPPEVSHVNITMGLPLKHVPLAVFFEQLFQVHRNATRGFYYKEVLDLLTQASVQVLFNTQPLINAIYQENKVYLSLQWMKSVAPQYETILALLFSDWQKEANPGISACQELIYQLKSSYSSSQSYEFELEYLYKFHTLFNKLSELNATYGHLKSLEALYQVYKELLNSETLDFKGEPLEGLQIMGMLESRSLDFETVIITSVNEGILPGGKTSNSMIPYDVKLEHGLPTYKEKDAVYTYHFYRLLQRAKEVQLIYNTEIDPLKGGEKSRFIEQLEVEGLHKIDHEILSAEVHLEVPKVREIAKTPEVITKLSDIAASGFSPSALTKYVRNPLDYYYQYVLGIQESDTVEETIAANTLGTILHESLELLYQHFIGTTLSISNLVKAKERIEAMADQGFIKHYGKNNYHSGKNLIAFEVCKRYLHNFLNLEIATLKQGHQIRIIALEHKDAVPLHIKGLEQPVRLKGTVDRIDEFDGRLRIIDYKSGAVAAGDVAIYDWEALITDYGKSKAFQLLCYAYIYSKSTKLNAPFEAGIISFKNLKSGFLSFGVRPSPRGKIDPLITQETLMKFEELASQLILEILDVNQAFIEKEV